MAKLLPKRLCLVSSFAAGLVCEGGLLLERMYRYPLIRHGRQPRKEWLPCSQVCPAGPVRTDVGDSCISLGKVDQRALPPEILIIVLLRRYFDLVVNCIRRAALTRCFWGANGLTGDCLISTYVETLFRLFHRPLWSTTLAPSSPQFGIGLHREAIDRSSAL